MKDIQYKELLHRQNELRRVQDLGIKLVHRKNIFKIVIGGVLVGVGLVTLPFPTGSIVMISIGSTLLLNGGINIYLYKSRFIRKIRLFVMGKLWGMRR